MISEQQYKTVLPSLAPLCPLCLEIPIIYHLALKTICKSSQILAKFSSTSLVKVDESGALKALCVLFCSFKLLVVLLRLVLDGHLPDEDISTAVPGGTTNILQSCRGKLAKKSL